jgi:hypothetical protein
MISLSPLIIVTARYFVSILLSFHSAPEANIGVLRDLPLYRPSWFLNVGPSVVVCSVWIKAVAVCSSSIVSSVRLMHV